MGIAAIEKATHGNCRTAAYNLGYFTSGPSIQWVVVLKIIKHYQEEGQGNEVVQGVLLGLVVEDRLEITNCFPFPQHTEDDADFDEVYGIVEW
ncbi:UNVERIFIED_CONTAM: hypothetical protein FKN15_036989 [Acipenser sinensis]